MDMAAQNPGHAVSFLWLIPFLPLLGSMVNGFLALRFAHRKEGAPRSLVNFIGCLAPALSFVVVLAGFLSLRGMLPGSRHDSS